MNISQAVHCNRQSSKGKISAHISAPPREIGDGHAAVPRSPLPAVVRQMHGPFTSALQATQALHHLAVRAHVRALLNLFAAIPAQSAPLSDTGGG